MVEYDERQLFKFIEDRHIKSVFAWNYAPVHEMPACVTTWSCVTTCMAPVDPTDERVLIYPVRETAYINGYIVNEHLKKADLIIVNGPRCYKCTQAAHKNMRLTSSVAICNATSVGTHKCFTLFPYAQRISAHPTGGIMVLHKIGPFPSWE